MHNDIGNIGAGWLADEIDELTEDIINISPSVYSEENRYLPESVTSMPGYIRYSVNPYMREIVDCFDINSPVQEVNLMKGVQITYTTAILEGGLLYYMTKIKTLPLMFMTADKELADARIENNIIPMLNQSGFSDIIRSSDEGNTRKTGKTKNHIQFAGGGYLVPFGANNANKMRSFSIAVLLKDEIDGWPETVGKDGDPDKLSDARCSGYGDRKKIFRGSTPLYKGTSKIEKQYQRGDQRKYMVLCKSCGFPQFLQWQFVNKQNGIIGGFHWETENGVLIPDSVCYKCQNCGEPHYEHDKTRLFSPDNGAHWKPTARPIKPYIRSYHLPAFYSPVGMRSWYDCVSDFLEAYDPVNKVTLDIGKYQVFRNNIEAKTFQMLGAKVRFTQVSLHRRAVYRLGQVPNEYAVKYSGSPVLFLTCQVDVHGDNLAVTVMGWCRDSICYVVHYERFECKDATDLNDPVWGRLSEFIIEKTFTATDGKTYGVTMTLVDAGYANDTVVNFCANFDGWVFPILGRDRPAKNQRISEFAEFTTQAGTVGYRILVDHYKDRLAPVLRREWMEESGPQKAYHFNAPVDIGDKQLKELTVESKREKVDERTGVKTFYWHRPGNARNELWDLLVYGNAAVEIIAWVICIRHFELTEIKWGQFWDYIEQEKLYFTE